MDQVARLPLGGRRYQAYTKTLRFVGVDLTGAGFRMEVRMLPNTPGAPLLALGTVTTAAAEGIRLIGVEQVGGGPVSTIGLRINKSSMEALPFAGELGDDSVFAYDLMVNPAGSLEAVWVAGEFVAQAGVTGATNAARAFSSGAAPRTAAVPAGSSSFQIGDTIVNVTVAGGQGPRGIASGPLGADSVGSEELSADALEQQAMLDKLALEGRSVSARLMDADPLPTIQASSPAATRVLDFARAGYFGETPAGMSLVGAATAGINGNGQLEVNAPYDDASKRAFFPRIKFREGRLRVRVVRGSGMIAFVDRSFAGRAFYMAGGALKYGYRTGAGYGAEFRPGEQAALPGADGDILNIELITGPARAGLGYQLRVWKDADPYPAQAAISNTYTDANRFNEGALMLSSFAGSTLKILSIRIDDGGNDDAEALATIAPVGLWCSRFEGGNIVLSTIRTGSGFRSQVAGTTGVKIAYAVPADAGPAPVLDCFERVGTDWVRRGNGVALGGAAGSTGEVTYPDDLDASGRLYNLRWVFRGISEGSDKWGKGAGAQILRVRPAESTGLVRPWPDERRRILFIGDSTTEGIVARGLPSQPSTSGGDISWPQLASEAIGRSAIISAFGGTGLLVGNLSNQPSAEDNISENAGGTTYSYPFGHAWNYMYGREIDTPALNAEAVVINLGINDQSRGVSAAGFRAGYILFLQEMLVRHPRARKIFAMRPFNGAFSADIQAAVTAVADPRLYFVDTTSWTDITTTDGLHPDVGGHAAASVHVRNVLRDLLP